MRKLIILLFFLIFLACLFLVILYIPIQATRIYGEPTPALGIFQRIQYSALLLWYDGLLTRPLDSNGTEQSFTIETGESVISIANHLQVVGLVRDAESFRAYLVYSGLDTTIQSGEYKLSTAMSAIDVARELQDATPEDVTFVILPGWRIEEIAASLSTSGLSITPEEFISASQNPPDGFDFLSGANTTEGFLYPDSYILSRETSADQMIDAFVRTFGLRFSADLRDAMDRQGLTIYQAVTIASLVEREAVQDEEKPLIASVFLNRFRIGMKLESDPTVQYALGYDSIAQTWWRNPLSLVDLQFDSPYNTYLYVGLPPAPIANPSLSALHAVAFPADTVYYFFRAKCDGSRTHEFAETFEEHLENACQ
ncbi:MAG TPA: endolytic transglycosylase MltG [Anaerolineales bacterium]|nr:endolytic transglycosylase MltG [Anaerolineales bacterium]